MKNTILAVALTLLAVSGALNWAFASGRLGSAHYKMVKLYEDEKSLTAYAAAE